MLKKVFAISNSFAISKLQSVVVTQKVSLPFVINFNSLIMRITKLYDTTPRGHNSVGGQGQNSLKNRSKVLSNNVESNNKINPLTGVFRCKHPFFLFQSFAGPGQGGSLDSPIRRYHSTIHAMGNTNSSPSGDVYSDDLSERLKKAFLHELCQRPSIGLTEVRRDGKDNAAMAKVITNEFNRCAGNMAEPELV